ncbi:Inositol 1-3-4-trisphosphate 5/6-kinase ATP-grasp domain [Arabidopsis thaliana x Arabidopsis arenosa]|uniref:Inositol-tetrakisphosphate 1-kinase n=1 Tax=Arabidopsis thaliana x Arabidopsis arenosa TaxID=1240361 RepID=A0A8T1YXU5_9BRAS|nr:Inositol 1-3-4-trisphosphate 5/6-kinase ATP-grasp domain [Arabidopsis thaliana x Arabidopsis arenosa]
MSDSSIQERYLVGYALAAKKQHSFIQPSLIEHSRQRGIDLVKLDPTKSLLEQGKLDCIIHKLYDVYWKENLHEFRQKCPGVPVIDLPEAIERLHNRVSMLEVITQLRFPVSDSERFGVPEQVVVMDSSVLSGGGALGELKFPVIAKPLDADGSAKSHKMFLIYDQEGMKILKAPIVLQEFVNHGGVIFKVYVVGDHVKCVKRRSLPDISEEKIGTSKGSLPFSQISNLTAQEDKNIEYGEDRSLEKVEMPPLSFLTDLAKAMRESMGLNLFNFDVIRDAKDANRYLIIDINYFPGYAKMPSYEPVLTEFFWDMVTKKNHV